MMKGTPGGAGSVERVGPGQATARHGSVWQGLVGYMLLFARV